MPRHSVAPTGSLSHLNDASKTIEFEQTLSTFYAKYVTPALPIKQPHSILSHTATPKQVEQKKRLLDRQTARHRSMQARATANQEKVMKYIAEHPEVIQKQLPGERLFEDRIDAWGEGNETEEMKKAIAKHQTDIKAVETPTISQRKQVKVSKIIPRRRPSTASSIAEYQSNLTVKENKRGSSARKPKLLESSISMSNFLDPPKIV